MKKEGKWYSEGFKEALEGLPADPPWQRGHRDYENYMAGYRDGARQAEQPNEKDDES
jgi:hypothetical protein